MPLRLNGEQFNPTHSDAELNAVAVALEVEGQSSAEFRWTELDQKDPAGRFRAKATGDELVFQRSGSAKWASAIDLMTLRKDEVEFHVPLDLSSVLAFMAAIVATVPPEVPSIHWLGEGYGPIEGPAGYLALMADGEDDEVYVPYWRKDA